MSTERIRKISLPARMLSDQTAPQPFKLTRSRTSLPGTLGVRQSAYKPLSRPAPRLSQVTPPGKSDRTSTTIWESMAQRALRHRLYTEDDTKPSTHATNRPIIMDDKTPEIKASEKEVERPTVSKNSGASKAEGPSATEESSQFLSPTTRPRSNSSVRRRPRQHRRRTGIPNEGDEDEDVPEELEGVVTKQSSDQEESESGREDSPVNEDIAHLRQLLQEERTKEEELQEKLNLARGDLESFKTQVLELNQRVEAASKRYTQEKKTNEDCNLRLTKLEENCKVMEVFRNENQRLKDENTSLIRVINQLSKPSVQ